MTKTLLDGPGRVLESVYPRFLVDLAQGDDARLPQAHQQQFRERLMQELLSRVQLQTWTNGGMLNAPLSLRLTLVEKLASMLDPGHLALTQIAQHLALLQKMDHRQHSAFLGASALRRVKGKYSRRRIEGASAAEGIVAEGDQQRQPLGVYALHPPAHGNIRQLRLDVENVKPAPETRLNKAVFCRAVVFVFVKGSVYVWQNGRPFACGGRILPVFVVSAYVVCRQNNTSLLTHSAAAFAARRGGNCFNTMYARRRSFVTASRLSQTFARAPTFAMRLRQRCNAAAICDVCNLTHCRRR